MNKIDIVKKAFDFDNPDSGALLADDFQGTDSVGGPPLDKASWQGMGELLRAAFPDISYVVDDIHEDGEDVEVTGRFTGTFTNDFDGSVMGVGVIPATGKAVNFPVFHGRVSFEGDKISRSHNTDTGPDAGLAGFLKALGAEMG